MVRALLILKEELGQRFATHSCVDEHHDDGTDNNARNVKKCSEPLPPGPPRIVENRLRHATETKPILDVGVTRVKPPPIR